MLPIVAFGGVLTAAIIGGTGGTAAHPVAGRVVGITIAACVVLTVALALCGCVVLLRATGSSWVKAIACGVIAVPMLPLLLIGIPLFPVARQTDRAFKKVEAAFGTAGKRWMPAPLIGLPTERELRALEAERGRASEPPSRS